MQVRSFQIDIARQIETPEFVMDAIPRHADWGYNSLTLYIEDAFRFPSHPEFAQKMAWTPRQMEKVVKCADAHGIKVIQTVPALGHTAYFLGHPKYRHLSEKRETLGADGLPILSGQLCPSLDESYEMLDDLFRDIAPFCTAGYLHVGMDESLDIGVCSLCAKRVGRGGHGRLFIEHLAKLNGLVRSHGLRTAIWGDMFGFFPELVPSIPKDVAVFDWYYYPFPKTPRVEILNFRDVDSVKAFTRAGLEVWACPNNGPFFCEIAPPFQDRLANILSWWRYGQKHNCHGLCMTSWAPNFMATELNFIVNAAAADLWLSPQTTDPREMLAHGLERQYGKRGRAGMPVVESLNRRQMAGYWRYQILRAPLDKTATLEAAAPFDQQVRELDAVAAQAAKRKAPDALRNTAVVRAYYAHRERLSRAGSKGLLQARQAVQQGDRRSALKALSVIRAMADRTTSNVRLAMSASRAMWRTARYPQSTNALVELMKTDLKALRSLDRFLKQAAKKPERVFDSCALLAKRQLLVTVRNRKPCMQGLRVEVSVDGKAYTSVHALYLLEFTADAGERHANFVHTHSIPLPDDLPDTPLSVRFRAVGAGEVDLQSPVIVDGTRRRHPQRVLGQVGRVIGSRNLLAKGWTTLGSKAPSKGFPTPALFEENHYIDLSM